MINVHFITEVEVNEFNANGLTYQVGDPRAIKTWWIMFHVYVRESSAALIPTNHLNCSVHLTNQREKLPEDMATIFGKIDKFKAPCDNSSNTFFLITNNHF